MFPYNIIAEKSKKKLLVQYNFEYYQEPILRIDKGEKKFVESWR